VDQHGGARPGPAEEGARRATGEGPGQGSKRFSTRREVEIVLRLYAVKTWNCFPGNWA
jgi:hypothetical protein